MVKNYNPDDYHKSFPIIPHGLSVVITAPRVFEFTGMFLPFGSLHQARQAKLTSESQVLSTRRDPRAMTKTG